MKKLHDVRQFLLTTLPEYQRNPDRIVTLVEDGKIEFHRGPSLSHGYTYTAQIVLLDYSRDVDHIVVPLLMWMQRFEPDVDPHEAIQFEAEILDEGVVDLILRIRFNERVVAKASEETGKIDIEHKAPAFDIGLPETRTWSLVMADNTEGAEWTI